MTHPEVTAENIGEEIRWPATGLELGVVVVYVIAATLWERAIKKRALAQRQEAEGGGDSFR